MTTYITLPFRDRKGKYKKALDLFLNPFLDYLNSNINDYVVYIVEQNEKDELFNLGRTINIGFDLYSKEIKNDDIFIFHPIDLLPIDVSYKFNKTTKLCSFLQGPNYYKAIAFLVKDFKEINGFSNNYWGWGLEDIDLCERLKIKNINVNITLNNYIELSNPGTSNPGEPNFSPLYEYNNKYLDEIKIKQDCLVSGLNTLSYKKIEEVKYNNVLKYIVE